MNIRRRVGDMDGYLFLGKVHDKISNQVKSFCYEQLKKVIVIVKELVKRFQSCV
jgi:hypothetical protein